MFSFTNTPNKLSDNQLSFLSKYPTLSEYYKTTGKLGVAPFDKLEKLNALLNDVKTATSDIMVNEIGERETLTSMPLTSMPEGFVYVDDYDNTIDDESRSSSTDADNKTDIESRSSSTDADNKTDIESRSSSTDAGNADVEVLLPQLNDLQQKVEEQIVFKSSVNPVKSSVNPVKKSRYGFWGGIKHKTSKRSKKGGRKTHKKSNNKKITQKKGGRKIHKSTNKKQ